MWFQEPSFEAPIAPPRVAAACHVQPTIEPRRLCTRRFIITVGHFQCSLMLVCRSASFRKTQRAWCGLANVHSTVDVTVASRLRLRAVTKSDVDTLGSKDALTWLRRGPKLPVASSSNDGLLERIAADLPVGGTTRILMPIAQVAATPSLSSGVAVPMLGSGGTAAVRLVEPRPSSADETLVSLTAAALFSGTSGLDRPLSRASAPAHALAAPALPGRGTTMSYSEVGGSRSHAEQLAQWDDHAKALHEQAAAGDVAAMAEILRAPRSHAAAQALLASRQPASGATALHQLAAGAAAGEAGAFESGLQLLLSHGLGVDCRAGNGSTPLHWAAGADGAEACRALLRAGADVFAVTYTWNRQIFGKGSGRSPLHWAAEAGAAGAAAVLLEASAGAGAGTPDERGLLAAEVAAGEGHSDLSERLRAAAGQRFVVLEIEKLAAHASAHTTAPAVDTAGATSVIEGPNCHRV